jgi:hypothetical protein
MKKVVVFYFNYRGNDNRGHRITKMTYSIFKRKSDILDDFFDWIKTEQSDVQKVAKESCAITNMQIIGL